MDEERIRIGQLKEKFADAKRIRQEKLEYDSIGEKILVYPGREEMELYVVSRPRN